VSRAERAAAEQRAALEQAAAQQAPTAGAGDDWMAAELSALQVEDGAEVEAGAEDNWMEAELSSLQAQAEALEEEEEVYSDPGADSFFASLDDIENLEPGGADFDDAGANAFVASMEDIALLVRDSGAEAVPPGAPEPVAAEPSVILAHEVAPPAPGLVPGEAPAVASGGQEARAVGLPFDDEAAPAPVAGQPVAEQPVAGASAPVGLPFDPDSV
jgi:hypothetical protein